MKYFFDTCIWRDFYEYRYSKSGNPLGKFAYQLFKKIISNKEIILFSEALIWELRKQYSSEEINTMLNFLFLTNTLKRIDIDEKDFNYAKQLSQERNLPKIDCLFALQAKKYNAVLVSQDKHLIQDLRNITKAKRPQEII